VRPAWVGVAVALVVVVAAAVGVLFGMANIALPIASAGPSLALAPSPTPRPTRSLEPTLSADALRVYPTGPVPADYRFVVVGDPGDERLLLLDLGARTVKLAAHFEGFGSYKDARVIELTSTASADLFVIHLRADGPLARLYFIRPATADVRTITIPRSESPRLSPDATTIAVSRNTDDPDQKGLWLLSTSDGTGKRVTTDGGRRATRGVQWSSDGARLAALLDPLDFKRELVIVEASGTVGASLGPASDARWRGTDLLYWNATAAGPVSVRSASGATGVAYDPPPGGIIDRVEPKPRSTDLAVREHTPTTVPRIVVYDSARRTASVVMPDAQFLLGFWWSPDASRLYVWTIDNGTTHVRDVLHDEEIVTFCFRAKIDPPCR
jgi:hypothetical protein